MTPHLCPVEGWIMIDTLCNWCDCGGRNPLTGDQPMNYERRMFATRLETGDTREELPA